MAPNILFGSDKIDGDPDSLSKEIEVVGVLFLLLSSLSLNHLSND